MIELIEKRTRNSKTHSLGGRKFSWDGTIGSLHYEDNGWQEIDNIFEPTLAPWDWEMLKAGYHIRVKEGFNTGQIIEFEKQGETVQFQPMALEWTNDLDQIQQVSMPQNVTPVVTSPEVDLLPAVGMPSHQGTIRWDDSYGQGIDFEWKCTSTRLTKILEIESLNNLPAPQQYILDGGNPVLRLNLIFVPSSSVDIYVDGQLWNKRSKKQTFDAIEFRKDGEVLWGFLPLRYWASGTDPEINEGQSIATIEKRGNKLYISIRVPYSWLQTAVYPVFIDIDVDEQVAASADDADEQSDGTVVINASDIHMGSWFGYNHIGQRFASVTIPDGSNIGVAYLTWKAKATDSGSFVSNLWGEDVVTPAQYTTTNSDITDRTRTTASVAAGSAELGNWTNDQPYNSPSIVSIVEELMASYSYASGAVMNFVSIYVSGDGERIAESWDRSAGGGTAPKLHIEYTAGGGWANNFIGVANASIKTVTGTAKANIKTVTGVA